MSFYKDIETQYFTKQVHNNKHIDEITDFPQIGLNPQTFTYRRENEYIDAVIEQQFQSPMLRDGSQWLLAVERFELNTNSIPFYSNHAEVGFQGVYNIIYANRNGKMVFGRRNVIGGLAGGFPAPIYDFNPLTNEAFERPAYSLDNLVVLINRAFDWASEEVGGDAYEHITCKLDATGKVSFWIETDRINPDGSYANQDNLDWNNMALYIPPLLNKILGMVWADQYIENGFERIEGNQTVHYAIWESPNSRWDCGAFGDHIRIVSNLGVTSDRLGGGHSNILTDLSTQGGTTFTMSLNNSESFRNGFVREGTSVFPRQKLVYAPQRLRWLNLNDPSPIVNIRIEARYVLSDGETERTVQLGQGESFGIKLAFYSKK